IKSAILEIHPKAKCKTTYGQYENTLSITTKSGKTAQASKVDIANYIVESFEADFSQLDLKKQIQKLVDFIRESNPGITITTT
ncbi:MAG: hypothetical protein AAB376_02400, partial [Pseudomonadota bacterium]